jgi:myo-inositol 2-dehydrogenase / D-chiro-inositol 1-dehydrogenase
LLNKKTMSAIKIGIIGAGYIGGVHASILVNDERVEIAAIHDVKTECAKRLARSSGARVVSTPDEVIDQCDAIFVTTPNTKHVDLAIAAIDAGKHVFCEKPLATNVTDATRVFEKAKQTRGVFQVGHNRRFAPVYATLKSLLTESHIPHSAHVKMNRGELLKPVWTGDPDVTGGFLYETPIHIFDMMRFLFGEVESLYAIGSRHEYKEVDDFSVLMKFSNGLHATVATAADASWLFPFERVEVFCHHSTLVTREMETLVCSTNIAGHFTEQSMQQLPRDEKWGYVQEDRAFVDCIVEGGPPPVTAHDGLMSVILVDSVYASIKTNSPINLSGK